MNKSCSPVTNTLKSSTAPPAAPLARSPTPAPPPPAAAGFKRPKYSLTGHPIPLIAALDCRLRLLLWGANEVGVGVATGGGWEEEETVLADQTETYHVEYYTWSS